MKGEYINKLFQQLTFRSIGNYRKTLVAFLLLTSFPGIILGFVLYYVSKTQMENELQDVHQKHLFNTIETIEDQFSYVERLLAHWAFEANSNNTYEDIDVVYNYSNIHQIYKTLLTMEGSNPLIEQVEIFLNKPDNIVFSKNGYTFLEDPDMVAEYANLLASNQSLYWNNSITSFENRMNDRYAPIRLIHTMPSNSLNPYGAFIVFLSKEKVGDLLSSPYEDGTVFLLREDDQWIFGNKEQEEPTALEKAVLAEMNVGSSESDPFLFQWEKITYTVTFDYFSRLGERWYYVSVAPLTNITAPVVFISKFFIILSTIIFLTAIILSLFISKKLYLPIDRLMNKISDKHQDEATDNEFEIIESKWNNLSIESENLKTRLDRQLPHLREGFLLQLVQGYLYAYKESDLLEQMHYFGWEVSNKKLVIIYVQLFGLRKDKGEFNDGDEGLVSFLAANIAKELMDELNSEGEVINFHNLSIGLIVTFKKNTNSQEINKTVIKLSESLIESVNKICHMDVSVSISRVTESIKSIHGLFEETKMSLSFRNLQENNQIIQIEKLDDLLEQHETIEYPFELEKEITHAIRLRNETEAIKILDQFIKTLSENNNSEAMMKQGSLQLLASIFHIVLQSGVMNEFITEGTNIYEELSKMRDPEDIRNWFENRIIIPIIKQLSYKQDQRVRLIVEKVVLILQDQYMDDISLDYCADSVNMSPPILSKVFKEITGWNFIDYLTNIRLEKAKELLIETDMKIKSIAEDTGYKHSYFNRLFKKHEGVTPSDFREQNRKEVI